MRTLRYVEVIDDKNKVQLRCSIDPGRKTYELYERTYECGDDGDAENGPRFFENAGPWRQIDEGSWDGSDPTEEGILNRYDEVKSEQAALCNPQGRFAIRDEHDGSFFSGLDDGHTVWDMRDRVRLFTQRDEAIRWMTFVIPAQHPNIDWSKRLQIVDLDTAVSY